MADKPLPIAGGFLTFATPCVSDVHLHPPLCVPGTLDLVSVCRKLSLQGLDCAVVRDGDRVGLFCATDLRDALLLSQPPAEVAVRDIARFDFAVIRPETPVTEALRLMDLNHRPALLVHEGADEFGVIRQSDLVHLLADLPHRVASDIEKSGSFDELLAAAMRVEEMVAILHKDGARVERVAYLVGELNASLLSRLWSLVAPPELHRHSCLVVMGSEGRGEQIVKSDQDNALLLRDGHAFLELETVAAEFNVALRRFGYPPCPGNIMLSNPLWRQSLGQFKETLRRWVFGAEPEGVMNLAIFLDAKAVAGDVDLLLQARRFVHDCVVDNDAFFARFARAAVQFGENDGWWSRLFLGRAREPATLDLKKLGTFPIVHGARALALQHRIEALDTAGRLRALAQRGVLAQEFSQDLIDSLRFMMVMKMQANLRQRAHGSPLENRVLLSDLSTLERGTLRGCLAVIRSFRRYLQRHFRLDAL